jgi:hypothetical protein
MHLISVRRLVYVSVREIVLSVLEAFQCQEVFQCSVVLYMYRHYRNNPELNPAEFFEADLFI